MKTKLLIGLIPIMALIINCSSDSNNESNDTDNNPQEQYKLIKTVTYPDFWFGVQTSIQFSYQNDLLVKELDNGELLYLGYNNDDNVSEIKECGDQDISDINLDSYSCSSFYPSTYYVYENERLVGLEDENSNLLVTYAYDGQGNLISEIGTSVNSEDVFYNYDSDGNITSLTLTYQGESSTRTFELDGKKNPFNVLWEKYNYKLEDLEFEPYDLVSCLFKQNATKVFRGSELLMEASYTYDSDGYPLTCVFTEYLSNGDTRQGTVTYSYVE